MTRGSGSNSVMVLEHLCTGLPPQLIHWDRNPGSGAASGSSAGRHDGCRKCHGGALKCFCWNQCLLSKRPHFNDEWLWGNVLETCILDCFLTINEAMFKYVCFMKFQNLKKALEIASLIHFWYRCEGKGPLSLKHDLDKLKSPSCRVWCADMTNRHLSD